MQDVGSQATGTGGGNSVFGSSDRRLRPHFQQNHQDLKCPRCDSLNTKFCYYNNYNLSQPRHFCKSCRRYWTKGGILRNVPIGGGCRKSNRSSKQKTSSSNHKSNSHSHSKTEASTLTGTTAPAPDATSITSSNSGSNPMNDFFKLPPTLDFPDNPPLLQFKFNETDFNPAHQIQNHDTNRWILNNHNLDRQLQNEDHKIENPDIVQNDLLPLPRGAVELDWPGGGEDEGWFDLTATTVDQCYWTPWRASECTDHDHHSM